MATTPLLLLGTASTCTGDATVEPLVGEQIVTDGGPLAGVQAELTPTVTVVFAVVEPPGPVAVSV
jgi:hypothetical protein